MSTLLEKTKHHEGIAIAGIVNLPGEKVVEIYGEVHTQPNPFCVELIEKNLLSAYEVLCEHSTVFCHVKEDQHKLFETATGSEYVFYKLMTESENKPICFDNRLENNMPSSVEEMGLVKIFSDLEFAPVTESEYKVLEVVIPRLGELLDLVIEMKPVFSRVYSEQYENIQKSILVQFFILRESVNRGIEFINGVGDFIPDRNNKQIISRVGTSLVKNIRKLYSAFVDFTILKLIGKSQSKKIVVFTGASHAYRLLEIMLKKKSTTLIPPNEDILPQLLFVPEGSLEREIQFVKMLTGSVDE